MDSKHAIVIDKNNNKKDFVLVDFIKQPNGEIKEDPQYYIMQEGDKLIYEAWDIANGMLKPRWNGTEWEETATLEELEAAKPEPLPAIPTQEQRIAAVEDALLAIISGGVSIV